MGFDCRDARLSLPSDSLSVFAISRFLPAAAPAVSPGSRVRRFWAWRIFKRLCVRMTDDPHGFAHRIPPSPMQRMERELRPSSRRRTCMYAIDQYNMDGSWRYQVIPLW